MKNEELINAGLEIVEKKQQEYWKEFAEEKLAERNGEQEIEAMLEIIYALKNDELPADFEKYFDMFLQWNYPNADKEEVCRGILQFSEKGYQFYQFNSEHFQDVMLNYPEKQQKEFLSRIEK